MCLRCQCLNTPRHRKHPSRRNEQLKLPILKPEPRKQTSNAQLDPKIATQRKWSRLLLELSYSKPLKPRT